MKKVFNILLIIFFLSASISPCFAYPQAAAFLCETGLKLYREGRVDEALHEFRKALLAQPGYEPALIYIEMIEETGAPKKREIIPTTYTPVAATRQEAVNELIELYELQREMVRDRELLGTKLRPAPFLGEEIKAPAVPGVLTLDDSFYSLKVPIEIEEGKSFIVKGRSIQRFLVTNPDVLTATKSGPDELTVTAKSVGYSYLHIWDDNGRWTTEWLGIMPKIEGLTLEESLRRQEERAGNFRLKYSVNWSSFESGPSIDNLERTSHTWTHSLRLNGETPYGDLDSAITVNRRSTITDLSYASVGLTNGRLGQFKDFGFRVLDFYPLFYNLTLTNTALRGLTFFSPAFDKKLDYSVFWGREGGGRYGIFAAGIEDTRDAFLEGFGLNYSPSRENNYKFSMVHGYGSDRLDNLNKFGYDLIGNWLFDKWHTGYEVAFDSETFAHLFKANYIQPRVNFGTEIRNIDKKFVSMTGVGLQQGQLGVLSHINLTPTDDLSLQSKLDVYQDRLFPAEDNNGRWNEDFDISANYVFDTTLAMSADYSLQNDLGRLSQFRSHTSGTGISKRFRFFRDIFTSARYTRQENTNFTSPSLDYINDKILLSVRFSLIRQLYYFANKEFNWLNERATASHTQPSAFETGVDWNSQLGKSPFWGSMRFTYRDEEDTISNLAFLSGEDYIEGYSELTYRPTEEREIYGSMRVRNSWADNPNVLKRIEATFNAGMRYAWDTGLRWETVGNIEGYVFKDINSDGLRQRDEPPVEGMKVWLGRDKSLVTDLFGYYKFKGVRARKAYVSLDTSTIPAGFVLTVPATQEIGIMQNQTLRLDFGIFARTEISGYIFEDIDANGMFGPGDKSVGGVIISLEDGSKAVSDNSGRYSFTKATRGEHTLSLNLSTLPVYYLPQVAITKEITLFEGVSYYYNVPLKRIQE
ncbi:MAG: SdrD B-like domain-containing protein [Candidatus Omnitrophota bacterium]